MQGHVRRILSILAIMMMVAGESHASTASEDGDEELEDVQGFVSRNVAAVMAGNLAGSVGMGTGIASCLMCALIPGAAWLGLVAARQGSVMGLSLDALIVFSCLGIHSLPWALATGVVVEGLLFVLTVTGLTFALAPTKHQRRQTLGALGAGALSTVAHGLPLLGLLVVSGSILITWLGFQQIPDVLMVVGWVPFGIAVVLGLVAFTAARPITFLLAQGLARVRESHGAASPGSPSTAAPLQGADESRSGQPGE